MDSHLPQHRQQRWLNSLVHQQGKFILALPVSCLITSLFVFSWLQFKTVQAEDSVQHTQQVRLEAKRLLTALLGAETEVRGYELTRDQEFLKNYESAIAAIPVSLEQLRQLVSDHPSQAQQVEKIRAAATARVSLLQGNLNLLRTQLNSLSEPSELVPLVLEGKQAMDRTRAEIEKFLAAEEKLQMQRNQQLRQQQSITWLVIALSAGFGMGGSLLAAYLLHRLERKLIERDRNLRESEARYRAVVENFPNGAVFFLNSELRYLLADGHILGRVGLSKAQLEGKTIWEALPADTCALLEPLYRDALAGTANSREIPYADRTFLVHTLPVQNEKGEIFAGIAVSQDITESKHTEEQLHRVNRALKTLSESNQAVVRATDELTLLPEICRIIVVFGGYRCVWIGFAEQDEAKTVRPVAQAGYHDNYLESIQITWSDTERGRGPTGTAIRTGQPSIAQNILTDPSYLLWREAALQRGYAASIALPLIVEGNPLGALNIYATEPNAFNGDEVKLLTELANDLAYGISALRTQLGRQRAEVALRQSKQRLDSILNSLEDVVWSVCAATYEVLYLNPATEEVYRRPVPAFFDNSNFWLEVVHPEDWEQVSTFYPSTLEMGSTQMEYRILRPDGEVRWLLDRASVTYDQDGTPVRIDGIATDITERKQAEEALRASEERFRAMFEKSHAIKLIIDPDSGAIVDANPAALSFYGYSRSELLTKTIVDINTLSPEQIQAEMRRVQAEERHYFLFEHKLASGEVRDVEIYSSPIEVQGRTLLISLVHDITARKQAEIALQESEERFRAIFEQAAVGIVLTTPSGEILRVNQHYCEITGYTQTELLGRSFQEITYPDDLEQNLDYLQQVMTGQMPTYSMEKRYIRTDGNWRWVQVTVSLVHDSANGQRYALGVIKDIHDRQQAQEALRGVNQTLQALIQASPLAIVALEPDGRVKTWNEAAEKMFGWSATEVIGTLLPIVPADKQDEFRQLRQRVLQGESLTGVEALRQNRDGRAIYISISAAPLYDAMGRSDGIMAVIADISDKQAAEDSLRDSEAKFRAFLEAASEAVIVTNAKGEIVVFNAKAEELFGYNRTEAFGRTVEFLMPERYHQIHTEHRAHYKAHPTKRSMGKTNNLLARRKDGTEFPIEAGLSPVQTKDGRFVMTFLTDITERKQAEEEIKRLNESLQRRAVEVETRYQQIVELAEEGIWVIDDQGKTTYVNQAMTRMLGYTEQEMLGRPMFDFIDEASQLTVSANLEQRKQGSGEKHEFKLKTKNCTALWTYMSTSPVLDESGKLLWSCTLVYNITERKKADEQLRESSERISLANAELARATRLKDEFLANMSHELRTPLNAILGLAEALQEEVYGSLTDRQKRSLMTIEQSGKHLLDLITDILDLSKIESGKMDLQITSISVQSLLESSLTFVKQQAHHKNIKLNSKIPERLRNIEVDERRMRQVLVNLLSNAVKFTSEGGEVQIQVETDAEAEILKLIVIDTGIGIAPGNLDKLFKPFVQLDSSLSRRYAGTGLGLALVRRIVELHGGSISLESEVGKGSQFTVTLPWKEPDRGQSVRKAEQELEELPSIQNALIVEDSETAAKQVARYLSELGSAALIHPQGEGAVEAAQQFEPEVIILDLLLPHISGWEVLEQLKANPATRHIPVLVISVVDERSRAFTLGASEYLVKPISRKQLQSALRKIFVETSQSSSHAALVVMPEEERHLPLVLLAEDNEANISTVMDFLQVHGFRVSLARNGVEAVQIAHQYKPDLILMDIQMPEMDGIEATQRIHSNPELAKIPIIALTALAMPGDRERCLAAGALEYLTKPVSLKKLVNVIAQYINTSNFP